MKCKSWYFFCKRPQVAAGLSQHDKNLDWQQRQHFCSLVPQGPYGGRGPNGSFPDGLVRKLIAPPKNCAFLWQAAWGKIRQPRIPWQTGMGSHHSSKNRALVWQAAWGKSNTMDRTKEGILIELYYHGLPYVETKQWIGCSCPVALSSGQKYVE